MEPVTFSRFMQNPPRRLPPGCPFPLIRRTPLCGAQIRAIIAQNLFCGLRDLCVAYQEAVMVRVSLLCLALCTFGVAGAASAQQIHLPPAVSQSQGMGGIPVTSGNETQRQQAIAANQQRQEELKRDSEKMFQLTQELNDYLQKSGDKVASIDALKKAEQIEKLAKSVRAKMKQSF